MQFNNEEDEKVQDPFQFDERLQSSLTKIFEQKGEEITKAFSSQFIDHILDSANYNGVIFLKILLIISRASGTQATLSSSTSAFQTANSSK